MPDLFTTGSAVLSDCGLYRYRLERRIGDGPTLGGIMVNPSTADANEDDPTIRRWIGFATRLGFGRVVIGNLFAYRSTDVKQLAAVDDPVGPDNDRHLVEIITRSDTLVVGWGALAKLPKRLRARWCFVDRAAKDARVPLMCFGTTKTGDPMHPLFLPYDSALQRWDHA